MTGLGFVAEGNQNRTRKCPRQDPESYQLSECDSEVEVGNRGNR